MFIGESFLGFVGVGRGFGFGCFEGGGEFESVFCDGIGVEVKEYVFGDVEFVFQFANDFT